MFQAAIAEGYGDEDMCSTIKVLEELGGRRGRRVHRKYTKNCCIPKFNILLLESSRGGNSHQSETNLIKKTPEAILPGARKGLGLQPKQGETYAKGRERMLARHPPSSAVIQTADYSGRPASESAHPAEKPLLVSCYDTVAVRDLIQMKTLNGSGFHRIDRNQHPRRGASQSGRLQVFTPWRPGGILSCWPRRSSSIRPKVAVVADSESLPDLVAALAAIGLPPRADGPELLHGPEGRWCASPPRRKSIRLFRLLSA